MREAQCADIRNVVDGDPSPDGKGTLSIARGIEVGHVFQLGLKYSEAMKATVLDEQGRDTPMIMGCYGFGVSRAVAAAIEQNHDDKGIIWPAPIAPFQVALLPMNMKKSQRVREATDEIYAELQAAGMDVLLDDRLVRPGVMFSDMELIGIPHRVVVGEKNLDKGMLEYKARRDTDSQDIPRDEIIAFLTDKLAAQQADTYVNESLHAHPAENLFYRTAAGQPATALHAGPGSHPRTSGCRHAAGPDGCR